MTTDTNDKKMMTKRVRASDRTTVNVSYSSSDAQDLRKVAQSITLKGDKRPSLSLITRRSLQIYCGLMYDRTARAHEIHALNAMVTRVPSPAPASKVKAPP